MNHTPLILRQIYLFIYLETPLKCHMFVNNNSDNTGFSGQFPSQPRSAGIRKKVIPLWSFMQQELMEFQLGQLQLLTCCLLLPTLSPIVSPTFLCRRTLCRHKKRQQFFFGVTCRSCFVADKVAKCDRAAVETALVFYGLDACACHVARGGAPIGAGGS